jgi:hypothetical protein
MKKILIASACALMLTTSFAAAQSSQGKGGAAMTGESADPTKTPGAGMAPGNQDKGAMTKDGMSKNGMGTSGMSNSKNMGGANKNGDGQMTKGGMNK